MEKSKNFLNSLRSILKINTKSNNETEMKLNDDCLFIVFQHLTLSDLMNVAKVSAEFYYIALYEFKRRHSNQVLTVLPLRNTPDSYIDKIINMIDGKNLKKAHQKYSVGMGDRICIEDYSFLMDTLKYFGCLIRQFDMSRSGSDGNMVKTILQHLTKHSARSLVQLHLGHIKVEWLNELKDSFPKLNEFTFSDSQEQPFDLNPKSLMISEKFPNLRRLLFLNSFGERDAVIPDEYFPNLEYVKIQFKAMVKRNDRIDAFLKQNSHIRHLEVAGFPDDYIIKIHSFVPNLVELTIGDARSYNSIDIKEPIHFEHLKSFDVRCYHVSSLERISFSNLQELRISYNRNTFSKWEQFYQRNHTFTRFEIEQTENAFISSANQLIDHIARLPPSVVEVTLTFGTNSVVEEAIAGILERRENLMKLTFKRETSAREVELRNRFETHWHITNVHMTHSHHLDKHWSGLQFTRRN